VTWARQTIAVLALLGVFVSLYLWLHRIGMIGTLTCGTGGGCEVVQTSSYAVFLGLPVALHGVIGYAVLLALSLAGLHPRLVPARALTLALLVLATGGLGFTLYLKYLEFFVIGAVCRWCVVSALLITAIWVVVLLAWRHERAVAKQRGAESGP
jgi:uncharacterized membrane protein